MKRFFLIIGLLCKAAIAYAAADTANIDANQTTLVVCDIEGSLFYPHNAGGNLYSSELLKNLQKHQQSSHKILYIAKSTIASIFWQKSLNNVNAPLDNTLSLSNEIFMGFNGSQPSCQKGVVLCQGHPFGAVISVVFNQLWIKAQLHPDLIIYYTSNQNHANQLKTLAERIGTQITIKMVNGCNIKNIQKIILEPSVKQPDTHTEIKKIIPEKPAKISKSKPPLVIDQSKLVGV